MTNTKIVTYDNDYNVEETKPEPYPTGQFFDTSQIKTKNLPTFIYIAEAFSPAAIEAMDNIEVSEEDFIKASIAINSDTNDTSTEDVIDTEVRNCNIYFLNDSEKYGWLYAMIKEAIIKANNVYGFDLWQINPIQYSVYDEGQFYGPHIDMGGNATGGHRKLSFSILISDPDSFEGGDLEINDGSPIPVPRKKGSIVIFPSFKLHEVKKVTKGTRKALVGWITGPDFK